MPKKILTVGLQLASNDASYESFASKTSLLDWDIVLFRPIFNALVHTEYPNPQYNGKPSLTDEASFTVKEACDHWHREIRQAVQYGKTVVVFLPPITEVYVATGQRSYSGTGRSRSVTRHVDLLTNYAALPFNLVPVNSKGSAMKLAAGAEVLAPYWTEFGPESEFKVILTNRTDASITTKAGNKAVGALLRFKEASGTVVLLPDIEFQREGFLNSRDNWTPAAKQFAARMISALVALDGALKQSADVTPEPDWAGDPTFALVKELTLRSELLEAERQLHAAQLRKDEVQDRLKEAGQLRALLYEKGKPLERAILEALRLLGFEAAPFRDANSEFDVVFKCPEGRLIGEVEGKDTKAINVDKLRQLAMNVQEDLQREEVDKPAKGVLFGNGYRLSVPSLREPQFTDKCQTAAKSSNFALVATSDLFNAAQYAANSSDAEYARRCRDALLRSVGIVALPNPPSSLEEGSPLNVTSD
jgi:hypothetical protein